MVQEGGRHAQDGVGGDDPFLASSKVFEADGLGGGDSWEARRDAVAEAQGFFDNGC